MARHALKVILMSTLLERRQPPLNTLPEYLDNIPVYREIQPSLFSACAPGLGGNAREPTRALGSSQAQRGISGTGCWQFLTSQPLHLPGILNNPVLALARGLVEGFAHRRQDVLEDAALA